jgi:hypothetical protein
MNAGGFRKRPNVVMYDSTRMSLGCLQLLVLSGRALHVLALTSGVPHANAWGCQHLTPRLRLTSCSMPHDGSRLISLALSEDSNLPNTLACCSLPGPPAAPPVVCSMRV